MPVPIAPGDAAPPIEGVAHEGAHAVVFYKVTCPVCQMAAPKVQALADAFPDRVTPVGQDPADRLSAFADEYGMAVSPVVDAPPYDTSESYGVRTVPTVFLVEDGTVVDTVEGWDRAGFNRVAERLAELTGTAYRPISEAGDGLPPFRPG
jgi:thiol-disulfide isomerase/thioredoxin